MGNDILLKRESDQFQVSFTLILMMACPLFGPEKTPSQVERERNERTERHNREVLPLAEEALKKLVAMLNRTDPMSYIRFTEIVRNELPFNMYSVTHQEILRRAGEYFRATSHAFPFVTLSIAFTVQSDDDAQYLNDLLREFGLEKIRSSFKRRVVLRDGGVRVGCLLLGCPVCSK
jgi:hypothetical protein